MQRILLLSLCVALAVALPTPMRPTFTSGPNKFSSWSFNEKLRLLGTIIKPLPKDILELSAVNGLPDSFDARQQWPSCIHPIRNQGHCGSCWAHGASEAFSDRLCIRSNGTVNVVLSPEQLVSCDKYGNMGCNGGIPLLAWGYMGLAGLVSDSCFPYSAGNGTAPVCEKKCVDSESWTTHKVDVTSVRHYGSEDAIMSAIYTEGPIEATFMVRESFMEYTGGVYSDATGKILGGHAIKMLGWGVDNGVKYWLCANSWGEDWGESGYFRILRGADECGIESGCVAARASETKASLAVAADSKICTGCKAAADQIVNKLINIIFQGTVVGGCGELCSHLDKNFEKEVCDGLCVLTGEVLFEQALQHVQLNPEELCYLLHVCKA